jgi:hypothetical protein
MTRNRILVRVGLLIYIISFALFAFAGGGGRPVRGYGTAILALLIPWQQNPFSPPWIFHDKILDYVALLISGWINPLFLMTVALMLHERHQREVAILRIILLLMIPFCWIVFYFHAFYPREGHFLWLFGMILALFSSGFRARAEVSLKEGS